MRNPNARRSIIVLASLALFAAGCAANSALPPRADPCADAAAQCPAGGDTNPTSELAGTVVESKTSRPRPDVIVTATSPYLLGEQVVVTDESGAYKIPQLPCGCYTVRFEYEGFATETRQAMLAKGGTARIDVALVAP